ncbi:MAG: lytic transglycosylase domain-containing protein [Myxococcota bacterium]
MSRRWKGSRVALAAFILLLPGAALADEALARRLAALRAVADPASSRAVPPRPAAEGCGAWAWWRSSRFAIRDRVETAIRHAALRYALDPRLIRSVIRHESNHDPDAVSHRGAMGLMQLMPATARELGVACAFDPRENVLGGSRYLRRLRDRLGSWPRALAAYHAGPARVEAGRIPGETRRYVARILDSWRGGAEASAQLDGLMDSSSR